MTAFRYPNGNMSRSKTMTGNHELAEYSPLEASMDDERQGELTIAQVNTKECKDSLQPSVCSNTGPEWQSSGDKGLSPAHPSTRDPMEKGVDGVPRQVADANEPEGHLDRRGGLDSIALHHRPADLRVRVRVVLRPVLRVEQRRNLFGGSGPRFSGKEQRGFFRGQAGPPGEVKVEAGAVPTGIDRGHHQHQALAEYRVQSPAEHHLPQHRMLLYEEPHVLNRLTPVPVSPTWSSHPSITHDQACSCTS
jgi:hypothetical protein